MTILKIAYKVIRIEAFVLWLSAVLMIMNALEVKLLSLISFLILIASAIFFVLMDARMVHARRAITRIQGLQMTGIYLFAGILLLFSPISMAQRTALDSYNRASLIFGITLLLINSIFFVVVWMVPQDKPSG